MFMAILKTPPTMYVGLGTALNMFGYRARDNGFGVRHRAANDAVRTLAALHGLTYQRNITELVLKQYDLGEIQVFASVQSLKSKLHRAFVHVGGHELPSELDTTQKLAIFAHKYNPIAVAADTSNHPRRPYGGGIHTPGMTFGCVCFKDKAALLKFVHATNHLQFGHVRLRVERAPMPAGIRHAKIDKGTPIRRMRQRRRKSEKKQEFDCWKDSFGKLFALPDNEAGVPRRPEYVGEHKTSHQDVAAKGDIIEHKDAIDIEEENHEEDNHEEVGHGEGGYEEGDHEEDNHEAANQEEDGQEEDHEEDDQKEDDHEESMSSLTIQPEVKKRKARTAFSKLAVKMRLGRTAVLGR
ncbi:Uu.00g031570.m01.CDS01 [Anthostomella pinea]|uniref:Uu.00g031570.m01.CDS01 n=1 Tax=Anthostomella pinea TaxID=933095 RepID=A0AAI8V8D2_9PEZI|nr:Uu.00g031570.m01.CDS01 [Anthostomella pinea]